MYRDEMALLMRLAARKALQIHLDRNRDENGYTEWCAVTHVTGKTPEELYKKAETFAANLEQPSRYGHTETFALMNKPRPIAAIRALPALAKEDSDE